MQLLVVWSLLLVVGAASARPEAPAGAPYPPSGWRPEGRQFLLPSRSAGQYAPPPQQYGPPPPQQYGPPPPAAPTTTEAAEPTTTEVPTTTAPSQPEGSAALESGVYYLLQPDGRLQRVSYAHGPASSASSASSASASAMLPERLSLPADPGYLARFHYQDLLPQGAPVYTFRQPGLVRIA